MGNENEKKGKPIIKHLLKKVLQLVLVVIAAITLAILLRAFFIATFKIPSQSMQPVIETGDHILVNKMIPGPRIFTDWRFLLNGNMNMKRWKGLRQLKRGEVIVFNFPRVQGKGNRIAMDFDLHYVKRIVGMPGDTLGVINGFYSVTGVSDTLGNYESQLQLAIYPDSLLPDKVLDAYPHHKKFGWTIKNFGPLYIPRRDDILRINMSNLPLYRKIIEYETNKRIEVNHDTIYFDGNILQTYTCQQNYYFMGGDQVMDSRDSRYWGFLPEDHIIGKVSHIWKSEDPNTGKIRWDRILKKVK
jgi:signal peptidase I